MKTKTINQAVKLIKQYDPNSACNESMLTELITTGNLPAAHHGNRTVIDFDILIPLLNQMLGLENEDQIPHLRTIRSASNEIKQKFPDLGIGEKQIRASIENEQLDVIRIGNHAYIAMEFFEKPYVNRFSPELNYSFTKKQKTNSAIEQFNLLLSNNSGIPRIKRKRNPA